MDFSIRSMEREIERLYINIDEELEALDISIDDELIEALDISDEFNSTLDLKITQYKL